jgi:hypothetical protein
MVTNTSHYSNGGETHRHRHAEGDMTGVSPITGERSSDIIAKRKGGRACHAEGDIVAKPYSRGGHSHRRRHRHADGDMTGTNPITGKRSSDRFPKLAAGGAGKVRKGMLSKNGKIINSYRPH